MKRGVFVISVSGGLCNRLRVLICAISYCEKFNYLLMVRWPLVDGFQATLDDLFDCPYRSLGDRPARILRRIADALDGLHADVNYEGRRIATLDYRRPTSLVTYVETIEKFGEQHLETKFSAYGHGLMPVPEIRSLIRRCDDFFRGGPVVGVSIRHTKAHPKTLEASPPDWFITRVHELHRRAPHLKIFLSCDDPAISAQLRRSVSCPVLELDKPPQFNSTASIRAAVADLYLLGQSTYILGSFFSSFSEAAFEIQGTGAFETSQGRSLNESQIATLMAVPPRP